MPTLQNYSSKQDLLVKYLYNDCSQEEAREASRLLMEDDQFCEEFFRLLSLKKSIQAIEKKPSKEVTDRILSYSKSLRSVVK
ncbi:hypothetical protein [Algivirga pacifica]|uniref:hypothetical protein n=1 Tax=Algivirga pacifica TaxID=1162670 RepID=UPI0031EB070F